MYFLFARRPVVISTVTTTTIPKTTIKKSEKKDQNRGQKFKKFHGNLDPKWGEFQKNKWTGHHF